MEMISLTNEMALAKAVGALQKGGVVLYPTDTLYGLGADAISDEAVATIREIKGREDTKPLHAIVSSLAMADRYGHIDERVRTLIAHLPQGKITCIVQKRAGVDTGILKGMATFGFRIPDTLFCRALCDAFGGPITATSANKSGQSPERAIGPLLAQLGSSTQLVDVVVNGGELPPSEPSTVVDFSGDEVRVLRVGCIATNEIMHALVER